MRFMAFAVALTLAAPVAAFAGDLTVKVVEVQSDQGNVLGALYNNAGAFLKPEQAAGRAKVKAAKGEIDLVYKNLAPGKYAVSVFHDENDNGKLDRNNFGIPTEGYGFSNDAHGNAGPPSFDQAAIDFDGKDKSITVDLDY